MFAKNELGRIWKELVVLRFDVLHHNVPGGTEKKDEKFKALQPVLEALEIAYVVLFPY
jgi:hypothetical protein